MSLLRRIGETVKRLAGKVRERQLKKGTPPKDRPKVSAWATITAKAEDKQVGWYYRALLAKRDRAEARDKQSPNNGTLVWNSAAEPFNQGRNAARKALRERTKVERARRRRERRTQMAAAMGLRPNGKPLVL